MIIDDNTTKFSRRGFLKGATAIGGAAALSGCGSSGDTEYILVDNPADDGEKNEQELTYIYGSATHNCGGRCVSKAVVSNGRIIRILTDESIMSGDGTHLNTNSRNLPQTRTCSRCRGYRYRVHHPGRLRYPMKQTKKRGDLTGFERISWEQAYREIATKHKKVTEKYGLDGIYVLYDSAANAGVQGRDALEVAYRYMGYDNSGYVGGQWKDQFGSYSTHQNNYMTTGYTGMNNQTNANDIAGNTNTLVLWGENAATTYNNAANALATVAADMRKRDAKIYFIGPEFSDTGIVMADEWLPSKPFTDVAIIAGMLYHMLDNTFDLATGGLKADPWLDIDWLDTMVYGFFDSPAYTMDPDTGTIDASQTPAAGTEVQAVESGRSYCSWILGNNQNAKTYAEIGSGTNYTAGQFAAESNVKRWAPCSYEVTKRNTTVYKTKQDFTTPKTPAWAAKISGVPEDAIKDLARRFIFNGPVASFWSGGQQKQAEGCQNLFAVQALQIITKNVAEYGATFGRMGANFPSLTAATGALGSMTNANISKNVPASPQRPTASCTAWHTIIKAAFAEELYQNGYHAKYIPNWPKKPDGRPDFSSGVSYWDDGGTKAAVVQWKRELLQDNNGKERMMVKTYTDDTGTEYFDWEGRTGTDGTPNAHEGNPVYAGIRLMYNSASNIVINQHENSNDSMEMMEYLNLNRYDDPDTFCLVTFDNFMSPTTRWSDYVLPASTAWEHPNYLAPNHTEGFFVPQATPPPGESKQAWDFCKELLTAYEKVQPNAKGHAGNVGIAASYAGGNINNSIEQMAREKYYGTGGPYSSPASPFFGKKWEEYLKNPVLLKKANDFAVVSPAGYAVKQAYNQLTPSGKMSPFIKNGNAVETNKYDQGGYNQGLTNKENYADLFADTSTAPNPSMRYHVYSRMLTWQYENCFSKWHGYLPTEQRGQPHRDFEGDRLVLEIPVYYAFEDYFMEAYGNNPATLTQLPFLLTTTHDKYRSHSSLAENPLLRELCHRVPGQDKKGKFKQGNDFGDYAMGPAQDFNKTGTYPYLARAIEEDGSTKTENKEIASYNEIWINYTDAREVLGIQDGDLVQVENPIGAVRCVAHLSRRCARGFVGLHQGCWFDPRPIPNGGGGLYNHLSVDVGGNCNTLMASQPSRIDHGNGQQSAMVRIFKVS